MTRRTKNPHHDEVVRRAGIVFALILFMYSLSVDSPVRLAHSAASMLGNAAIGMAAGVEPNPYNSAAAQLAQKQTELEVRESVVHAGEGGSVAGTRVLAAASLCMSFALLVLVAGNYYMDFRRTQRYA